MDTDFELYKGKNFKDLCKDIYNNQEVRKQQIELMIGDLRPMIKTVNDAMVVVPLIKGYLDAANTNDEHLVKLASIVQKIITAHAQLTDDSNGTGSFLTDEEKKQLMAEVNAIKESDALILKKIKK